MAGMHGPERKWRIRNARTREDRIMPRVYELLMPGSMGIYERYMSIEAAMDEACRVERTILARPRPRPPIIPSRNPT